MADRAISALPTATVLTATDLFVLSQSNQAKNTTWQTIIGYLATALDGHGGIKTVSYTAPVAPSLNGTLTITLADNTVETFTIANGNGVASVTQYWAVSSSNSTEPSTWYTTMQTMTTTNKYLWSYLSFTMDDTTTLTTTKSVVGVYGDTGQNWYVWIKYAGVQPTSDADMGDTPDDWIGIYSGTASSAPAHYTDYSWFEIKGDKGDTGDSISAVTKTSGTGAPGTTDVYTVYVNGVSVGTFNVYQGSDGTGTAGTSTPLMDGAGAAGSSLYYSRQDHVHPTDTSRASQTDMTNVQNAAANKVLYLTSVACSATTGNFATVSDAAITANHVLVDCVFAKPSAITTNVTWTTASGSLTLNGTCASATTADIVLIKKDN